MKPPETILLIIRRSLGDVLAVSPVVDILARRFASASIDLLVNQDTAAAANLLKGIRNIIAFDDGALKTTPVSSFMMQIGLLQKIFRRYDLAMAFTTNERSNLYAFFAGRTSIGAREKVFAKNWWHRLLLDGGYLIDPQRHILENNLSALSTLGISIDRIVLSATYAGASGQKVQQMLKDFGMDRFIIFHPSGRYRCKSYPEQQRNSLLRLLDSFLREDPDVILVGEMRDLETISLALTAAETGHLVFATLHTSGAPNTIDRIVDVFPAEQQNQVRSMIAESLQAIVSQVLFKKRDGRGRVAAFEIMISNPAVRNLIRENKIFQIPSIMQTSKGIGMQTMEASVQDLIDRNLVGKDEVSFYLSKVQR